MSYIQYQTKDCPVCEGPGSLMLWADDVDRYLNGALAQDAFADLLAPAREQIISGTHPRCWVKMIKDDDERSE
jgi:hypothetical protein